MLSAADLARMRATLRASLPDTCTIKRPSKVSGPGGMVTTYNTLDTLVPCRVSPMGRDAQEFELAGTVKADEAIFVTFPYDQNISSLDRIFFGTRTFEVIKPLKRSWQIGLRVFCKEIK